MQPTRVHTRTRTHKRAAILCGQRMKHAAQSRQVSQQIGQVAIFEAPPLNDKGGGRFDTQRSLGLGGQRLGGRNGDHDGR
jgi:hypothetical protein